MRRIFRVTCQREERGRRLHCDPRYEGRHKFVIATSTLYVLVRILFFKCSCTFYQRLKYEISNWQFLLTIFSWHLPNILPTYGQFPGIYPMAAKFPDISRFSGVRGEWSRWTVRGCFLTNSFHLRLLCCHLRSASDIHVIIFSSLRQAVLIGKHDWKNIFIDRSY